MDEELIKCELRTCQKILTEKDEIEYSQELTSFYCCPDHALEHYFDYMRSTPFDHETTDRHDVYFKNGKLYKIY